MPTSGEYSALASALAIGRKPGETGADSNIPSSAEDWMSFQDGEMVPGRPGFRIDIRVFGWVKGST